MSKVGIFSWFSYPVAMEERMRLIKKTGFDAVSLWWGAEDRYDRPTAARKFGLEIDNVHAPFMGGNSLWFEETEGDKYLKMLMSCVEDCNRYEIETVVIHATGFMDVPVVTQVGIDRIGELVLLAEKRGVNLAFENLNRLEHLDYILKNFTSEKVGFCYDSGHENCYHPDAMCLNKYGNRLMAIHLDDNMGDADSHLLPFDGNARWNNILKDLKNSRDLKYLTLEVDFSRGHKCSEIYKELSAQEFLRLAFEKVKMIEEQIV